MPKLGGCRFLSDKGPDLKELQKLYKAQVEHQAVALGRVKVRRN